MGKIVVMRSARAMWREAGLVEARQEAQRRVYSFRPAPLAEVDQRLGRYRSPWEPRMAHEPPSRVTHACPNAFGFGGGSTRSTRSTR
jgi:hypothetical protein